MFAMPSPEGYSEQYPPVYNRQGEQSAGKVILSVIALSGAVIIYRIVARNDEDALQMEILHAAMRLFHTIARTTGRWALETEQSYNEIASTLH